MDGNVVAARRLELGLTQQELADLYGICLWGEPVTRKVIEFMEKNGLPKDRKRRAVLATLLGIPLSAVGIEITTPLLEQPGVKDSEPINIEEYRQALEGYQSGDLQAITSDILRRQRRIHDELPYASNKQPLAEILCRLHITLAEICQEQLLPQADPYFRKAIILAKEYRLSYLYAFASFQRGVFLEVAGGKSEQAYTSYTKGLAVKNLPPQLQGQLLSSLATSNAQGGGDISEGLTLLDQAAALTGDTSEGDILFDSTRWHLNRAEVLLFSPLKSSRDAKMALADLEHVSFPDDSKRSASREIVYDILSARAHIDRGDLALATQYASDAARVMMDMRVFTHTHDIETLYSTLKASPYGNTKAVMKFSVDLLKVRYSSLFN